MTTTSDQNEIPTARDDVLIEHAQRQVAQAAVRPNGGRSTDDTTALTPVTSSPAAKVARHFPKIEGYRIVGVVGHGGMGIVYEAVQTKLNRTVALKVLPAIVGTANPSAVARFRREASAAARLHHTHIVPIYDFGESRDSYYYAMELISGKPLNTLIRSLGEQQVATVSPARMAIWLQEELSAASRTITDADSSVASSAHTDTSTATSSVVRRGAYYQHAARWMADAADALHYAHGQRIIHRDIKPANMILAADARIMIADFGLAKTEDDESVTMTGTLIGTLRYLSPEQAMAKRIRVDHRTDIYSLGATLYELLCFQPAFPGRDEKEVLGAIITRDPVPPQRINGAVPPELGTICLKCMEKDPNARYSTARELAEDLNRYINDLPIVARRPGPVRRTRKFLRRHKAVAIAVAAGLVLTIGASLAGWREYESKQTVRRVADLIANAREYATNLRWQEASDEWKQVLDLDPRDFVALANLAIAKKNLYNNMVEPDPALLAEADDLSSRALAVDPVHDDIWNLRGVILKKLERYAEAAAAYQQATELDPENSAAWQNLGVVNALNRDLDQARVHLLRSARFAGTDVGCEFPWRNLAALELHLGDLEAVEHVEQAVTCNRTDPATLLVRAKICLDLEGYVDVTQAVRTAEFADIGASGSDARVKRLLARAYLEAGAFEDAARAATAAIELDDMRTVNHLMLAIAKARLDDPTAAKQHYETALAEWPAELSSEGDYAVTAPKGVLWFESADQLLGLKDEADGLLSTKSDGS